MHLSHGMCGTLCIVRKLNRFFVHVYYKKKKFQSFVVISVIHKRGSRGGTRGPEPPSP